jgi:hypothetical protein
MLDSVVQQLGQGFWLPKLPAIQPVLASHSLTREDADQLIETALSEAKKNHKGRALNFMGLALAWNQPLAITAVRRRGILRASSYDLDHRIPSSIVTELLRHHAALKLEGPTRDYLQSWRALLQAAPYVHTVRESLRNEIRRHFKSLIQGALAVVDFAYLTENTGGTELPAEDLAEGCSYLLALQIETMGPILEPLPLR